MSFPSILTATHLSKRYGKHTVVQDVSLTVSPGEIFGLLGPNGAGKTTTIKMITGLTRPSAGRVMIAGYDVWREPYSARKHFGVVLDSPTLYERFTVEENLKFFQGLYGTQQSDQSDHLIETIGLHPVRAQRIHSLSKGWKQRVQIARALVGTPTLVFLDEPSSGLDPNAVSAIHQVIRHLAQQGISVILTTHDMIEAAQLCHRVAILYAGQIVACDTPESLVTRPRRASVRVTVLRRGIPVDEDLPWNTAKDQATLCDLLTTAEVVRIHSQEPSLGEVFQQLTGGGSA